MAGVASQFITLTTSYQLLPANAIDLVIVGGNDLIISFTKDGEDTADIQTVEPDTNDTVYPITSSVLHYVKASGPCELYYGVS